MPIILGGILPAFKLDEKEVANGIHTHHDHVTKKMMEEYPNLFSIGEGIFVLTESEKKRIGFTADELKLIKPFYTSQELQRYCCQPKNKLWVIYTGSEFKNKKNIIPYPNIKKHLDRFSKVITSDNWPYGLHRARDANFFKSEKVIALRKCPDKPLFTYTDFDCYVPAMFYVIKSERINLKFLTALLNSKLIAFWLRHKGKMQGTNYQIDKEPLLKIPICIPERLDKIIELFDQIILLKSRNESSQEREDELDILFYKIYEFSFQEALLIDRKLTEQRFETILI